MTPQFVHLHCHSEYSLVDGLLSVKALPAAAVQAGMPAVAITDQCNLFAMVKFYRAALAAGVKPIIGAEVRLHNSADEAKPFRLILLCQHQDGFKNLAVLISKAYIEGQQKHAPILQYDWLCDHAAGLIALSGAADGDVGQALLANDAALVQQRLQFWQQTFADRYYLQIQRIGKSGEEALIAASVALSAAQHVPLVATNAVCFLTAEDFEAHEARVCIHDGWTLADSKRPRRYSAQQYLRSADEMQALFADLPEALQNTVAIAKRCNMHLQFDKVFLPDYPVPDGGNTEDYFTAQAKTGLEQRLSAIFSAEDIAAQRGVYDERLATEIKIVNEMGFAGYFLIVADFIRWSKHNNIPVGPGRGSGAGSLVAYALGITALDPIEHGLLFERFLNPERVSLPDFDIDFCMEGRDRVIEYVAEKYGRENVSQIITFGTMAARAVVRDVGRVLGHPYGFVDKLAKLIPFEIGMTLKNALRQDEQLLKRYQDEDEVRDLIDLALKLEGTPRNAGKHAGGVVIAPTKLTDYTPLYCEQHSGSIVSQFDKGDIEAIGLVKFDFLGLRTLTIIFRALQTINQQRRTQNESLIDIDRIPMDDKKTFELLKSCATTAVFQLESRGMKDLIKRLQPDCFEDIMALVALFRPGPLQSGMVDDYIARKHGQARVTYLHPKLELVLKSTYGVMIYQDQVMQVAQILAGYSLGAADVLRSAMGKKKLEEMAKQRASFVDGASEHGVDPHIANEIFDLMEKFAGYGFNKSHSAAYALISYQTAWLKAHYPAEFIAAVLSSDMDNTDKVVRYIQDCKKYDIIIVPPALNVSNYQFIVDEKSQVIFGLGAIKGVGEAAVENIINNRLQHGAFKNLFEFCQRVDARKVNRKVLEALIRAGAMDCFKQQRATLMASIDNALRAAEKKNRDQAAGQNDLFSNQSGPAVESVHEYINAKTWSDEMRLIGEKETLGFYLSGHPIEKYEAELRQFTTAAIGELNTEKTGDSLIAGFVVGLRTLFSKRGNRIAFVTLEDQTGRVDVGVFSDAFEEYRDLLVKDQLLVVEGEVSVDDFSGGYRISANKIYTLQQARQHYVRRLLLTFKEPRMNNDFIVTLQQAMVPFVGGTCPVCVNFTTAKENAALMLGDDWQVHPSDECLHALQAICGEDQVQYVYG